MWISHAIWLSLSRWSKFAFTIGELQKWASHHLRFKFTVKTRSLSIVALDPVHKAQIDRIMAWHHNGWTNRQITDHLNASGVTSFQGKQYYTALVFGIIRKALLRRARLAETGNVCDLQVWVATAGTVQCRTGVLGG